MSKDMERMASPKNKKRQSETDSTSLCKRQKTVGLEDNKNQVNEPKIPLTSICVTKKTDQRFSGISGQACWWSKWGDKVVSLDTEHVHYEKLKGIERIKAATVAICDSRYNIVYSGRIKHNPKKCLINHHTIRVNGLTSKDLVNGKPLDEVREEVRNHLRGRLVVVCAGAVDFKSLGLDIQDFEVFDLHQHWKQPKKRSGKVIFEPIGLKRLAKKYLNKEIHNCVHSASTDALVTMEIFQKVYKHIKTTNLQSKENDNYDQFFSFDSKSLQELGFNFE